MGILNWLTGPRDDDCEPGSCRYEIAGHHCPGFLEDFYAANVLSAATRKASGRREPATPVMATIIGWRR